MKSKEIKQNDQLFTNNEIELLKKQGIINPDSDEKEKSYEKFLNRIYRINQYNFYLKNPGLVKGFPPEF
jgi:hypothetical protein